MERNDFMVILSIIASIITVSTFLAFVIYPLHHPEVTSTQPTQPTPTAASIVTSTPQITLSPSPTVTPTPVVTPTQTPLHEPKYSHGDIVQKKYLTFSDRAYLILDYSPDVDNYETTDIYEVNGVWLYRSENEYLRSREIIEDDEIKVGHVDVSKVMSWEEYLDEYLDEYLEGGSYQKAHATPTSTPSKAGRWHSVITFTGSEDKTTAPFTIRGDKWRVKWSVSSSSILPFFNVFVYPRDQTSGSVSYWLCTEASFSDTQYIYERTGDYYFEISALNLDSWKLEVEDYY